MSPPLLMRPPGRNATAQSASTRTRSVADSRGGTLQLAAKAQPLPSYFQPPAAGTGVRGKEGKR